MHDHRLAYDLIQDEFFDLTLYRRLHAFSAGATRRVLEALIPIETRHFEFWQEFFSLKVERLDSKRRLKLILIVSVCRVFGPTAVHLVLESIEVYGIRKYLAVWEKYKETPLGAAVRGILEDEFKHEDSVVSEIASKKIDPERIRSVFLGFNDGLVEMLSAVSGFFAAFKEPGAIALAGLMVSVAGAISMAAGAYVASASEHEVQKTSRGKARFLDASYSEDEPSSPWLLGLIVGSSYAVGAMVPVLPVLLGSHGILISLACAATMIVIVSCVLSFLSGMDMRRRIMTNLVVMSAAVGISYTIGLIAKAFLQVDI